MDDTLCTEAPGDDLLAGDAVEDGDDGGIASHGGGHGVQRGIQPCGFDRYDQQIAGRGFGRTDHREIHHFAVDAVLLSNVSGITLIVHHIADAAAAQRALYEAAVQQTQRAHTNDVYSFNGFHEILLYRRTPSSIKATSSRIWAG